MTEMYLPKAKNDFLFTLIGDKKAMLILFALLFAAAILWRIFRKK